MALLTNPPLVFQPGQQPLLCQGADRLPVPEALPLELTAEQVFGWLKMENNRPLVNPIDL